MKQTAEQIFLNKLAGIEKVGKEEFKSLEDARYEVPDGDWSFKCLHCHYFDKKTSMCEEFKKKVKAEGCCCAFEHKEE